MVKNIKDAVLKINNVCIYTSRIDKRYDPADESQPNEIYQDLTICADSGGDQQAVLNFKCLLAKELRKLLAFEFKEVDITVKFELSKRDNGVWNLNKDGIKNVFLD